MTKYEVKIWHRGYADWKWRLRYNDHGCTEVVAMGIANNRQEAKDAAARAVKADQAERSATWREIGV
jgi:hypothetical protein